MCICVCVCVWVCVGVCLCVCVCLSVCVCVCVFVFVCVYKYLCLYTYNCMCVHLQLYICLMNIFIELHKLVQNGLIMTVGPACNLIVNQLESIHIHVIN